MNHNEYLTNDVSNAENVYKNTNQLTRLHNNFKNAAQKGKENSQFNNTNNTISSLYYTLHPNKRAIYKNSTQFYKRKHHNANLNLTSSNYFPPEISKTPNKDIQSKIIDAMLNGKEFQTHRSPSEHSKFLNRSGIASRLRSSKKEDTNNISCCSNDKVDYISDLKSAIICKCSIAKCRKGEEVKVKSIYYN